MYCFFLSNYIQCDYFLYVNGLLNHFESFSANKILLVNDVTINELILNLLFKKAQITSYEPLAYFHQLNIERYTRPLSTHSSGNWGYCSEIHHLT